MHAYILTHVCRHTQVYITHTYTSRVLHTRNPTHTPCHPAQSLAPPNPAPCYPALSRSLCHCAHSRHPCLDQRTRPHQPTPQTYPCYSTHSYYPLHCVRALAVRQHFRANRQTGQMRLLAPSSGQTQRLRRATDPARCDFSRQAGQIGCELAGVLGYFGGKCSIWAGHDPVA